jgi:ferritin-like metal-binding protein YciE
MKITSLRELYVEQLRDLYDGENQIIKALPKMIESTESEELSSALEEHLEVTRQQAQRLEQIFQGLGENSKGEKCKGMEGIIKEGSEVMKEDMPESVKDAAIIASAQRVEHYEIAGYGTVRTYAELLGEEEAVDLLQQTLDEEKEADEKLSGLAEEINVEAEEGDEEEDLEGEEIDAESEVQIGETQKPGRATKSAGKKNKRVA